MSKREELIHLDYEVKIDGSKHREAEKWCELQHGQRWNPIDYRQGLWTMFWAGNQRPHVYRFCFAHERDCMMFILMWS